MKRLLSIIVSLLLAFGLSAGAMAHVAESGQNSSTAVSIDCCEGLSKQKDDGQSDPSKASINLHGCHGHQIGIPMMANAESEPVAASKPVPVRNSVSLSLAACSDILRPPMA
ncbi:hypothetical protein [Altererythrobacter sp. B11]|uniref:hypothetical protein n=1 Tax=Altererythrobacter sp. B11 TaxID=2060312 RepID=UPI0011AE8449|nr:hypothetical protein [Altererythrobacter sp. B11]